MALTTSLLNDVEDDVKSYLETALTDFVIGTDNTAPTAGDSALGAEVFTDTIDGTDDSVADAIIHECQIGVGEANGNNIQEAGLENSGGTLKIRSLLNSINKTSDIQLFIDFRTDIEAKDVTP